MELQSDFGERTINELLLMFRSRQINLEPGFQRQSVWSQVDRRRLIQSVISNYPIPSIFLYRRHVKGRLVYDVIDGKQRLETLFMFVGAGRFKRDAYLLTVQGDTDSAANRQRRAEILRGLLYSLFERKDAKRTFSSEQRRIIWNKDEKKICVRCKKKLRWDDFTADHILAYAKGGSTEVTNAQLLCRRCNSKKGAR